MYECERYHIQPENKETVNGCRVFFIYLEPCGIHIEMDKDVPGSLGVYVMNNEGRTIDTIFRKDAT
jgi:hypothetical protein